jgi:hypothetical protein
MAVMALLNEYVSINAVNLSDHVRAATVAVEATTLDSTAMGDSWTENIFGLKSGTVAVEFNDDFVAASVDATLWPLLGTNVALEVRPDAGVVSASNPKYTGLVGINGLAVGGSLNEVARKSHTWPLSGALVRAIA